VTKFALTIDHRTIEIILLHYNLVKRLEASRFRNFQNQHKGDGDEKIDPDTKASAETSAEEPCPISVLPDEQLAMIFSHLSPKDLLACSAVDKHWNRVAFRFEKLL